MSSISLSIITTLFSSSRRRDLIRGTIPTEIGLLTAVRVLDLSGNTLIGPLPSQLGRLRRLVELSLQKNKLRASIPTELGQLTALALLNLNDNELTGIIPAQLGMILHCSCHRILICLFFSLARRSGS